jgi:hydroxyethylthiazole kinase-like sugar kinase family protein
MPASPTRWAKALAATGCLVTYAVAADLPAWTAAGLVAAVLAVLVVYESAGARAGSSAPS